MFKNPIVMMKIVPLLFFINFLTPSRLWFVRKVSMEWLAGEKIKAVRMFPPRTHSWLGYIEKDTIGQTNIYSVEIPVLQLVVYVAKSAIASGTTGLSFSGVDNTVDIAARVTFIFIVAMSLILLQVGKNSPKIQTFEYNGPALSYYISKFKP
ncbi:hypothetical protein K2173_016340 [Erythroxylum novogranatense]|uniref:Uncharacterized protein n=1 Tax=Erythroxylum novogranatense TaxID=1862640 RepID=A0AAV8SGM2_9ROSI|nr:hypothetical protein K2173_016340 [Erythroxylum novogranatense]